MLRRKKDNGACGKGSIEVLKVRVSERVDNEVRDQSVGGLRREGKCGE